MQKGPLFLAVVFMLIVVSGCTQYWYRCDRSFAQCQSDQMDCLKCLNCRTDYMNGVTYESKYIDACMMQKGYQLYTEDQLPLNMRREVPDDVYSGILKGVAGQI